MGARVIGLELAKKIVLEWVDLGFINGRPIAKINTIKEIDKINIKSQEGPMEKLDKLYVGTNTKMYKNIADTVEYLQELGELTSGIDKNIIEFFVIPSFTSL